MLDPSVNPVETLRDTVPRPAWRTRQAGPVLLIYPTHSFAAQDIDELSARYREALPAVAHAVGAREETLPLIRVYLADSPIPPDQRAEVAGGALAPDDLAVWTVYTPESPGVAPEAELTCVLLEHLHGLARPATRFWDQGLAGYLAAHSGRPTVRADPGDQCRQLLADGLLSPLEEIIAEAEARGTGLTGAAASAFADYLIGRYGIDRYRRLVRAVRTDPLAFPHVYHLPLTLAERDWRRDLEATGRAVQPSTRATLRRLLPLARPYWWPGLLVLFYTLVGIAFSLALPLAFSFLMDNILSRRPLRNAIPLVGPVGYIVGAGAEQLTHLFHLMLVLGLLYLLSAAARLRLNSLLNRVGESFVLDLRRKLMENLSRLPATYFARTPIADINHRVVQDTAAVQQVLTGALVPLVSGVLAVVLYATMLISLQARLALLALLGLPLLGLIYQARRRNLRAAARERVRRLADLSARVNELAAAQALVKIYSAAPYLLDHLARRLEVHRILNTAYAQESTRLGQVGMVIMNLTQVAVLLAGGYLIVVSDSRELAPGGLVAFYVLVNQLFGPVTQVASASQSLAGASASLERLTEVLEEPPEQDPADGVELGRLQRGIRFESVGFAYASGRPVLRQLSLEIPAGQTVAFVGPTGAGKSSVVQLLPRLYDPSQGTITWDGVDLRRAHLDSLRRQVLLVPQEALLLSATVYENIRFGLVGVGDEEVRRAARRASAHDFIAALPDGYDTVVGDHGVGLSGGQRQRVALARALLRDPSVLILDEATSALDATTQRAVQVGLRDGPERPTIVKIAHRLETVADSDVIFVLDDGRLVEQGRHDELLATGGVYARLFRDQMGMLSAAGKPSARLAAGWLARLAPFAALPSSALDELAAGLVTIERRAGETIYQQGSLGEELFVVGRGRVEALAVDELGRERRVNTLGIGTPFGVAAFLLGLPHSATVRAETDVLLFVLQRSAYQAVLERARPAGTAGGPGGNGRGEAPTARHELG